MGRKGFDDADVGAALDQCRKSLARLESRLEQEIWLSGSIFGMADIIALPLIDRMQDLDFVERWENDFPTVAKWYRRSMNRPSFDIAFYPKSRLSECLSIGPLRRG